MGPQSQDEQLSNINKQTITRHFTYEILSQGQLFQYHYIKKQSHVQWFTLQYGLRFLLSLSLALDVILHYEKA